ncbi:S41 family peptidase [Janthinobacterium fluminis]|uniref:S41 family peptidase n=1 Tax=Janthinobacterium fluminis TaxID=2987524 RepID=A0ABT5JX44_9BURK|nr:S41 family peptidase [Janthinobacterium fluminis]MDC8756733.1 S41 family peptidase [Janthinobacterium fluminis]
MIDTMIRPAIFAAALALACGVAHGRTVAPAETAMNSYARVQTMRDEAEAMIAEGATSKDARLNAARHLEAALAYLDTPAVRDLASGNEYLYFRGFDTRRDLAAIYNDLGMKDKALSSLEDTLRLAWLPQLAKLVADDASLSKLRDEPRFKVVMATSAIPDRLWNSPALAPPFKKTLTPEERVAGLSLFWTQVRENFVYFDHVPELEWDKIYLEYLSKVLATTTTRDYYRVLMQLAPLLHDGHTNIYEPEELAKAFSARPPMQTVMLDNKVLIESIHSASLQGRLKVGDEIVTIDDIPVQRYAQERVAPFVSSSTPQDRTLRMYNYQLLRGERDTPVRLRLRNGEGQERVEIVARSGYQDIHSPPQFTFRMLPGEVAYFSLDHFESDEGVKAFVRVLPQIMKAKSLVLDLRRNGGGSTSYGLEILSYLSKKPIMAAHSYTRADNAYSRMDGNVIKWKPNPENGIPIPFDRKQIFAGPVAVLIGPRTFSAGEDFVVSFETMQRGITIGEATGGSTGQPMVIDLPGGGTGRICVKRDTYPDGREFVGKGIQPSIVVETSVAALRAGRDIVLDRAISSLK